VARIPQETIDRVRETADIVDVVSHHVDLKKRGRNFDKVSVLFVRCIVATIYFDYA
jgi:DNA primase